MDTTSFVELRLEEDAALSEHDYEDYHALRYTYLLDAAHRHAPRATRVLDIGRSPFVARLERIYPEVWTLGFPEPAPVARHIAFDINLIAQGLGVPCDLRFDLVIFSEVVEHLHIPAHAALMALREVMQDGGVLIVQTPNAAEVMKRVALLRGRNPYEALRLNPLNPGHFREYTMPEMLEAARTAGLALREARYVDYFPQPKVIGFHPVRAVLDVCRTFVPAFRNGQTLILEKA